MMTRFREPVNGFTHLIGAALAAVGLVWLVAITHGDTAKMISVMIFGISLILTFAASTALHLTHASERTLLWLRRCDHAAIYLLIAGTYTPFCYALLNGAWRWGLLGLIWGAAFIGVFYKLFFLKQDGLFSLLGYVAMGWFSIIALPKAINIVPQEVLWLLVAGGLVYSLGAVVFGLKKPNIHPHFGFHELWHLFVLGGSALHFAAVVVIVSV